MPNALKIENSELPKARRFNAIRKDIESTSENTKLWYGHASYDQYDINDLMNYHSQIGMMVSKLKTKEEMDTFERTMVLNDIYYLGVYVLDWSFMYYTKTADGQTILRPWIFNRCREVQESPDFHVDIWAREHFKSTIITILYSVQEILRNKEVAIGIFSSVSDTARSFVKQIRTCLETPRLKELFPDVIPESTTLGKYTVRDKYGKVQTKKFTWSDKSFTVKRSSARKEPTVSGYGLVNALPTGMHFDVLIYDDFVVPASVATEEQNKKTFETWQNSLNLGAGEGVKIRIIGTYYAMRDPYFYILNPNYKVDGTLGGGRYKARIYPCRDNGNPVLYTDEYLRKKESDMIGFVWSAQMMCNPMETSVIRFLEEWISERCDTREIWEHRDDYNIYILVDPANTKTKDSDSTAMGVICTGSDRKYYVPYVVYDKLNPSERRDRLFSLVNEWTNSRSKPQVFYESNSMAADLHMIQEKQKETKNFFTLTPASTKPRLGISRMPGGNLKFERIMQLEPLFRNHRIVLAKSCISKLYDGRTANVMQMIVDNEYLSFPFSDHDDFLDMLSRIADLDTGTMISFPDSPDDNSQLIAFYKKQNTMVYDIDAGGYQPW